jgi:hypothetical protein
MLSRLPMRRLLRSTGIVLLAFAAGGGCSEGVKEGMPSDASVAKPPEQVSREMAAYAKSTKGARGGSRSLAPPLGAMPRR